MPDRPIGRQRGFSLTELMVGVAVFSVVLAVTVAVFQRLSKSQIRLRNNVFADRTFSGFSQRFVADVMNADVGLHFLNLPVRFSCSDAAIPCVRKLEANGTLSPVTAPPGISTIQFYRDESGALENFAAYKEDDSLRLVRHRPLPLSPAQLASNFYVTWPLSADRSSPFVMMTRKADSSVYFTFPEAFAASTPPASAGSWTIVEASTSSVDLTQVKGSIFAIFNSAEPLQHYMQAVEDVRSCKDKSGSQSVCKPLADLFSATSLDLLGGNFYMIRFGSMPSLTGFMPGSKMVSPSGTWWNQSASEYLFPHKVVSLRDPASGIPLPDSRRILHFFHMNADKIRNPRLVALPVQLQAFTLEDSLLKIAGKPRKTVVRRDFYPARTIIVLRDLPSSSAVIMGRKLGTKDITVFRTRPTNNEEDLL